MSSDNPNSNSKTLELEISEKCKSIIKRSVFVIDTQDVILSLNHKYEPTKLIITIEKKWQRTHKVLTEAAIKAGVTDEKDIQLLLSHIDDHSELIRNSKSDEQKEKSEGRKSQTDHLYEMFLEKVGEWKLFKDQFKESHALVLIDEHYQVLRILGTEFRKYLSKLYYDNIGKVPNTEAVRNVIHQIDGKADYEGETIILHLRCGWANNETRDTIYYDLSDEKYRTVKIMATEGWKIVDKQTEVLFRRFNHQLPQMQPAVMAGPLPLVPNPDDPDDKDDVFTHFMALLNIKNPDDQLLMKCYIVSLFIPGIPHVILTLLGEQGGAKTTIQELIRNLVDPSIIGTLSLPIYSSEDVIRQLSHHYVVYYDNVSYIPNGISDTLCRAATGSSSSIRVLFTTDDEFYYNFMRVVGINSIDLAVISPDLEDRGIRFNPDRLSKSDRKRIAEIWKEFNELKPRLLAYIFDILANALAYKQKHGEIKFTDGLNRMADWEEWAEIISRCMDNPDGKLQRIYTENITRQIDDAVASSQLCQAILEFRKQLVAGEWKTAPANPEIPGKWECTPTELHQHLTTIAYSKLKFTNLSSRRYWPQSAAALTHYLNKVKTLLRAKGLEVITKEKDNDNNRVIRMIDLDLLEDIEKKLFDKPQSGLKDRLYRPDRPETEHKTENDDMGTKNSDDADDADDDLGAFAGDMKKNISVNGEVEDNNKDDIDIYNQRPDPRPRGYYNKDLDDEDPDADDDTDEEDTEPIV